MAVSVIEVVEALFARAPRELAEEWDSVGLVVGDPGARVRRALLCVDATQPIVAEARAARAQLIIAHHSVFLSPLKRLRADDPESAVALAAARAGVAVCAMHTNLDYAPQGLCMELARIAGLRDAAPLSPAGCGAAVKVAVFVPGDHLAAVRSAMAAAGAGRIGLYHECSFGAEGVGTYRPLAGAAPYAGAVGRLEQAPEVRLEMIAPRSALAGVLAAMQTAHPYDEIAYDIYPLNNAWPHAARGAVGGLARPVSLGAFAARVRKRLGAAAVRVSGDPAREIATVATCSGSGGHLVAEAAAKADALLAGELRHHEALRAQALGLALVEAGHYATERPAIDLMGRWLRQDFGSRLEVVASRVEADPFAAPRGNAR